MDLALKFCVAFCVGLFGGILVDQSMHTAPWGVLSGIIIGFILSIGVIIQYIIVEKKRLAEADPIVIKSRPSRHSASQHHANVDQSVLLTIDDLHAHASHAADTDPDLVENWFDEDDR